MDLRNWEHVMLKWIDGCKFIAKTRNSIAQTDLESFFRTYSQHTNIAFQLLKFLRIVYPDFKPIFTHGNVVGTDYIYVYTLLLHYAYVKNPQEYFYEILNNLPIEIQQHVKVFLQLTDVKAQLTRISLREYIANVAYQISGDAASASSNVGLSSTQGSGIGEHERTTSTTKQSGSRPQLKMQRITNSLMKKRDEDKVTSTYSLIQEKNDELDKVQSTLASGDENKTLQTATTEEFDSFPEIMDVSVDNRLREKEMDNKHMPEEPDDLHQTPSDVVEQIHKIILKYPQFHKLDLYENKSILDALQHKKNEEEQIQLVDHCLKAITTKYQKQNEEFQEYMASKDVEFYCLEQQLSNSRSELKEMYAKNKKYKAKLRDYSDCLGATCALVEAESWDQAMKDLNVLVINKCQMSQTIESLQLLNASLEKQMALCNQNKEMELEQQKIDYDEKTAKLEDCIQLYDSCINQFYKRLMLMLSSSAAKQQPTLKTSGQDTIEQRLAYAQNIMLKAVQETIENCDKELTDMRTVVAEVNMDLSKTQKRNDALVLENLELAKRLERELLQKEGEIEEKESRFKDLSQRLDAMNEQLHLEHNSILELMHKLSVNMDAFKAQDVSAIEIPETSFMSNLELLHLKVDEFLRSFKNVQQQTEKQASCIFGLELDLEDYINTLAKQSHYLQKIKNLKCVNEKVKAKYCRMRIVVADLKESLSTAQTEKEDINGAMETLQQRNALLLEESLEHQNNTQMLHIQLQEKRELEGQFQESLFEYNKAMMHIVELQKENQTKSILVNELQSKIKESEGKLEELLKKLQCQELVKDTMQRENNILQGELMSFKTEHTLLTDNLKKMQVAHELSLKRRCKLEKIRNDMEQKIRRLQLQREEQDKVSLTHEVGGLNSQIEHLKKLSCDQQNTISILESHLKDHNEKIVELNIINEKQTESLRKADMMKKKMKEEINQKEEKVLMLKRNSETLRSELIRRDTEQQNFNELLNKKLLDMNEQLTKSQNEVQELRKINENLINNRKAVDEVEEKLHQECTNFAQLKLEHQILQVKYQNSKDELNRLQERLLELGGNQLQLVRPIQYNQLQVVRHFQDDDDDQAEQASRSSDAVHDDNNNEGSFCKCPGFRSSLSFGFSMVCLLFVVLVAAYIQSIKCKFLL